MVWGLRFRGLGFRGLRFKVQGFRFVLSLYLGLRCPTIFRVSYTRLVYLFVCLCI